VGLVIIVIGNGFKVLIESILAPASAPPAP
jgi:hypothetical protein